jgi:hypothetical protein
MVTGRRAKLPPSIWKNPMRMQSGGWKLIENANDTITIASPIELEPNTTAPSGESITLDEKSKSMLELVLGSSEIPNVEPAKKKGRKPKNNNL